LFQRLHNKIHQNAGGSAEQRRPAGEVFEATKKAVVQAYRNIVVHDYLPRIVRTEQIKQVVQMLAAKKTSTNR
jgi:hypothetical protein